ncbi:toxin glutamine deamidase domain-containing protein [Actinomadura sp. DC4]|uniref:toxin glutamine deamidase domain-containing protein n=1 Tax=Actinomadura sp. DC4 TaxID=3055069 RepID=UPI0025B1054B|nr:toxin glutamine deamidase domain-containing protein [Actinomadura sp. DC4]MDN3353778.1 toxin glutamine deamidase domain-containing protein [Actinomadura sp. DC4]
MPKINPLRFRGGDFATNCVLTAIGTDLTLKEAMLHPDEDPARRAYYQVPPGERAPYEHILNLGRGEPVAVPGYAAIVDAMTAAGRGARGIVIVGVRGMPVGHVFNVVHDENGIVFLNGQQGRQAVLPAWFESLEFLPTSDGFPRESIAVDVTPGQRPPLLGAYGLEFETAILIHRLPPTAAETSGFVLAVNERLGYQVQIDKRHFPRDTEGTFYPNRRLFEKSGKELAEMVSGPVVEFVSMPFGMTGVPADIRAADRVTTLASIREKLETLREKAAEDPRQRPRLPARELFPEEEGWEFFPGRDSWKIAAEMTTLEALPITAPGSETGALFAQYTAGVPLTEMHAFLKYAVEHGPLGAAVLRSGLSFGDKVAQRFVEWRFGTKVLPSSLDGLGEIESVSAIRGMTALVYPHIASRLEGYLKPDVLLKNRLLVASRVAFAGIRQQLPDDAKTFLDGNAKSVRDLLVTQFRRAHPNYDKDYDAKAVEEPALREVAEMLPDRSIDLLGLPFPDDEETSIGTYLDNALLTRPAQRVDQWEGVGIGTGFDEADTNEGRLTVPLIPVELRGFGPSPTGIDAAENSLTSIDGVLGRMYEQARHKRAGIDQTRIDALLAAASRGRLQLHVAQSPASSTQAAQSLSPPARPAAGSQTGPLALNWRESRHSGGEACVSVAVVGPGPRNAMAAEGTVSP